MIIKVLKEDIRKGKRQNAQYCPIARAIKRKTKRGDVMVDSRRVMFGWMTFEMPVRAENFIMNFDAGKPVKPFQFELEVL